MRRRSISRLLVASLFAGLALFARSALPVADAAPQAAAVAVTFAVIGDYGMDNASEFAVANLVASWNPSFVIATGDDYYSAAGGSGTARYDESTGAYYCNWLKDIATTGMRCPVGLAAVNAFFPAMGNHDYSDATPAPGTYLTYFTLPGAGFVNTSGNERYYDFVVGPVHFFVLNSNSEEPDGTSSSSTQAQWLQQQLAASTSPWNIVYDHHPPYSSDSRHGSTAYMQWPYAAWGADVVISGHAHTYERIARDGIVYFVNGLGGAGRYDFAAPVAGSVLRYSANWGAQKVTASDATLELEFYDVNGELVDSYRLGAATPGAQTTPATSIAATGATLNGRVTSNGADTSVLFEFGLTPGYGSTANAVESPLAATASDVAVSAPIAGLACATTYHFRVVAANIAGSSNGADAVFTTAKCDQTITFGAAPSLAVGGIGTVSATATSGRPVTFSSATPSVCDLAGNIVTGVAAGTCTIAADQAGDANYDPAPQVTQSFSVALPEPMLLSVTPRGSGIGIVSGNLPGIECGADCSESYLAGTRIALSAATPFAGSAFGAWGGACTGIETCTVTMSSATNVTATFIYVGSAYSYDHVQMSYVAYYGRPADPGGQAYWAGRMDAEGHSLDAIIDAFGNSDEFHRRHGGLSYTDLVVRIYRQALNRDPDQAGLTYYVGELEAGRRTLQSIALDVLSGAVTAPDSTIVANRLDVAAYYTAKVAGGCPYGTEQDGVNVLSGVSTLSATVTAAKVAIDDRCWMLAFNPKGDRR